MQACKSRKLFHLLSHSSFTELINFQYNKTIHHSNFIKMYLNQPNTSKILYFSTAIPQVFQHQQNILHWTFSVITFSSYHSWARNHRLVLWTGQDRKKSFAKRRVSRASESFARLGVRRLVLFVYESTGRSRLLCLDAAAAGSSIHVLYSDPFPLVFPSSTAHPDVPLTQTIIRIPRL